MRSNFLTTIQILYDHERGHWVTKWFSNGKVYLMDSLSAEHLAIPVIFRNADRGNGVQVTALPVQQQRG